MDCYFFVIKQKIILKNYCKIKNKHYICKCRLNAKRNISNFDDAFDDFDKALQIAPTSVYALSERGWTKDMLEKDKEAPKDYMLLLHIVNLMLGFIFSEVECI